MSFFAKFLCLWLILQLTYAQQESSKTFVTCDFDLPEKAVKYLPDECKGLNEKTRKKMKLEAESFQKFNAKLSDYEAAFGLDTDDEIYKDWEFRAELYEQAEIHLCQNNTETLLDYLDCMTTKRYEMIQLIEDKVAGQ